MSEKTRGHKSSERQALYHAFIVSIIIGIYGIYKEADLAALGVLIGAICSPMMVYAGARSYVKGRNGEE